MKEFLLSLGWVDKGDVLVRYSSPRLGWKPADGTLIIGYHEYPRKVKTMASLSKVLATIPTEETIVHRNTACWGKSSIIVVNSGKGLAKVTMNRKEAPDAAFISDIVVLETERRKGLGNKLLDISEQEARFMNAENAVLFSERDSFTTDWYRRHGYKEFGSDDNLIYFWKKL